MTSRPSNTSRARKITCVGFDWRAEVSLKETLLLLRGKTLDSWEYSDELGSDVVVYDEHNALAQAMLRRGPGGHQQVLFSAGGDEEQGLSLRPPFGASRLIRCLDHASQQLAGTAALPQDRSESLCQRLDHALRSPGLQAVALQAQGLSGFLTPNGQTLYWPKPLGITEVAALLSGPVEVQKISTGEEATLQRIESEAMFAMHAEGLLWAIGITRSRGTLLQRLDAGRSYRLRRWPDFGVVGRRTLDLRCTSLLTQRELTPTQLALLSGMPLSVIGSFLNAGALCGLIEEVTVAPAQQGRTQAPAPDAGAPRFGGMLQRIRQAFALN